MARAKARPYPSGMTYTIRYFQAGQEPITTPWPGDLASAKTHASTTAKRNSCSGYEILDDHGEVIWPRPDTNQLAKRIVDIVTDDD